VEITFTPTVPGVSQPISVPKTDTTKRLEGFGNGQYEFTFKTVDTATPANKSQGVHISFKVTSITGLGLGDNRYLPVPAAAPGANPVVVKAFTAGTTDKYVIVYLGRIENVPVDWDEERQCPATGTGSITYTVSQTNGGSFSQSETVNHISTNTVRNTTTTTDEVTMETGAKFEAGLPVAKATLESKVTLHLEQVQQVETVKTETWENSFTQVSSTFWSVQHNHQYAIGPGSTEGYNVPGWWRYTTFVTCDVYGVIGFRNGAVIPTAEGRQGLIVMIARPDSYTLMDFDTNRASNGGFGKTNTVPKLELLSTYIPYLRNYTPLEHVIGVDPGLEVWGGKLTYRYRVQSAGTIAVTLIGGGAGGSGAAAARASTWFQWARADAERGGRGGDTVLRLNNNIIETAPGGTPKNGPDKKGEGYGPGVSDNGERGGDGERKSIIGLSVAVGDIIEIEVGYGGGGSGGAANWESLWEAGVALSDVPDRTKGSIGVVLTKAGYSSNANASRGGMGGMHSLVFPGSPYPSNLQNGGDSPQAGKANAASGGTYIGAGGEGGDEFRDGNDNNKMYASGGGGGAAGGFTLKSDTVALEPIN
jgi:hypothetical protein